MNSEEEEIKLVGQNVSEPKQKNSYYENVYVISIGIDKYDEDSDFEPFEGAVSDAKAMKELFEKKNFNIFSYLTDEEATSEAIDHSLENLKKELKRSNTRNLVLFYFAGGALFFKKGKRENFLLCPFDYDNTINIEENLRVKFDELNCQVVCIFDCCFLGSLYKEFKKFNCDENEIIVSNEYKGKKKKKTKYF